MIKEMDMSALIKKKSKELGKYVCIRSVKTLNELEKLLQQFDNKYIYRGQSDYLWALETSIKRKGNCGLLRRILVDKVKEKEIDDIVKKGSQYFSFEHFNGLSFLEKLAVLQHHGCYTQLLDFTYDPHIALFFAFEGKNDGKRYSVLWIVDKDWIGDIARKNCIKEWNKAPDDVLKNYEKEIYMNQNIKPESSGTNNKGFVFLYEAQLSLRMKNQKSIFLLPLISTERFVWNITKPMIEQDRLGKDVSIKDKIFMIMIPQNLRSELLRFLKQKGISKDKMLVGSGDFNKLNSLMGKIIDEAQKNRNKFLRIRNAAMQKNV